MNDIDELTIEQIQIKLIKLEEQLSTLNLLIRSNNYSDFEKRLRNIESKLDMRR